MSRVLYSSVECRSRPGTEKAPFQTCPGTSFTSSIHRYSLSQSSPLLPKTLTFPKFTCSLQPSSLSRGTFSCSSSDNRCIVQIALMLKQLFYSSLTQHLLSPLVTFKMLRKRTSNIIVHLHKILHCNFIYLPHPLN